MKPHGEISAMPMLFLFVSVLHFTDACLRTGTGFSSDFNNYGVTGQQSTAFGAECNEATLNAFSGNLDSTVQYTFDYSDKFGTKKDVGSTVAITCIKNNQLARVSIYDRNRASLASAATVLASCQRSVSSNTNVWLLNGREMTYADCQF